MHLGLWHVVQLVRATAIREDDGLIFTVMTR